MPAIFTALVNQRSQLAEEVMQFLDDYAMWLWRTPWARRAGAFGSRPLMSNEVEVEPWVLTEKTRKTLEECRRGDRFRFSPADEVDAARYELPQNRETRDEMRWSRVLRFHSRARLAIRGAPGSGKSFSTRHTLAAWSTQSREKIELQETRLENASIGLWVTAGALMQSNATDIVDALLDALGKTTADTPISRFSLTPRVREWLERALQSADGERVFVVVDALDELKDSERAAFEIRAAQLSQLPFGVLVTCRTAQWDERAAWLAWHPLTTLELVPLKQRHQREIVRKFFSGPSANQAAYLEQILNANFALRHACSTPLLMSFACLVHEDGLVNENTTYAELYGHMIRKIVSGEAKLVKDAPWKSRPHEAKCRQWLKGIGWQIFQAAPQKNRFTWAVWEEAAEKALKGKPAPLADDELLDWLIRTGFVMFAGYEGTEECWSFAHRTFLEYLAAAGLERQGEEIWLAEAKQHFWFDTAWLEVLTFLAGLVGDATPLLRAIAEEQENDDIFGSMLTLKARLLRSAKKVDAVIDRQTMKEVIDFWCQGSWEFQFWGFNQFAVIKLVGQSKAMFPILPYLKHEEWTIRQLATKALGAIGSEAVIPHLLTCLEDEQRNVRKSAAEALGAIGSEEAIPHLLSYIRSYIQTEKESAPSSISPRSSFSEVYSAITSNYLKEGAIQSGFEALGAIGSEEAIPDLLVFLEDDEERWRSMAAEALGAIGSEEVVYDLCHRLHVEDDMWKWVEEDMVRGSIVSALGTIGSKAAISDLLDLFTFENDEDDEDDFYQDAIERLHAFATEALWQIAKKHCTRIRI